MISKGDQVVQCLSARKQMGNTVCTNVLCLAQPLKAYFEGVHAVAREKWSCESLSYIMM